MIKNFIIILLLLPFVCFSQTLTDYKYVVVPERFDFQKEDNQYDFNNLVKMMFEKYGFKVYLSKAHLPEELALNRCKAMYADIQKVPGFLSTNLLIELRDCAGRVLFISEVGKSKEKDYKTAYYEALRKASRSLDNYNFLRESTVSDEESPANTVAPPSGTPEIVADETLFAQPIPNGYQLVDSTPQVVLRIYKTSKPDSFTAIAGSYNGLVFKKGDAWYFEYYDNEQLVSKKLNIKF